MAASNTPPIIEALPNYREAYTLHRSKMSKVFYAESQPGSGELVVVKQRIEGLDHAENLVAQARFEIEAEMLGELNHPQIPELLEDNTDHFSPHFVMAPVDEVRDLGKFFEHRSVPLMASRIIHSVLGPLGHVHDKGIVHRDIKTGNIFGRIVGEPVLGDFGIAARRTANEGRVYELKPGKKWGDPDAVVEKMKTFYQASTGLTDESGAVGTSDFMSPEQAKGQKVDITTDIYSLGLVFYQLLYGAIPFETGDPKNRDSILNSRLVGEIDFTIPAGRDIPDPLVRIVDRATQDNPNDRYQSAAEMREDIERAVFAVGNSLS